MSSCFMKIKLLALFSFFCAEAGAQGSWTKKADLTNLEGAVGFSIGTKGYVGTGMNNSGVWTNTLWEWNQPTNTWTQKASMSGAGRKWATGFSIGTKGYIGTGDDGANQNDFWEYDTSTDSWTQKANFGGTPRRYAVGFSIGTSGYIGTGWDGTNIEKDFWEWNQATNVWIQNINFGGTARYTSAGFSIGNKGYIGAGRDGNTYYNDFWEFDPSGAVAVNELGNQINISVFPNPSCGAFTLSSESIKGEISIHTISGEKIYESEIKNQKSEIDISNQSNGIYFLTVKTEQGTANKKIIIRK